MRLEEKYLRNGIIIAISIPVALCISVVCRGNESLPVDMLYDDWKYMCLSFSLSLPIIAFLVFLFPNKMNNLFPLTFSWVLIIYGGIVSVWGIRQMYGFSGFYNSMFLLTGSFYNPGPYSGYLAMILPICLFEWLNRKDNKIGIFYSASLSVMLLIIFVLPFGMSRSAWIAASVSSVYVLFMHYRREIKEYVRANRKKAAAYTMIVIMVFVLVLSGIYIMKKNSADGRFLMWKISVDAITKNPWEGYGWNSVAAAYGQA